MNRRDLLKYFAAGTIIGTVGGESVQAKLIEEPKIEPVAVVPAIAIEDHDARASLTTTRVNGAPIRSITVDAVLQDGSRHVFRADAFFVTDFQRTVGGRGAKWTISGSAECLAGNRGMENPGDPFYTFYERVTGKS